MLLGQQFKRKIPHKYTQHTFYAALLLIMCAFVIRMSIIRMRNSERERGAVQTKTMQKKQLTSNKIRMQNASIITI